MITLHTQRIRAARQLPAWRALGLTALLTLGLGGWAEGQSIAEVQVTPETMTLSVGQRQTLFAAAYDRHGNLIPSAKFTFWSSDTMVARVLRDGTVMGIAPGLAKVEARTQGRRASLAVLITGGADTAAAGTVLTLEPGSVTLLPGEGVLVVPQAVLEDGTPVPVGRVTWKSLRPDLVVVDSTGLVLAVAPGGTVIQASTRRGLMATLPVEVQVAEFAVSGRRLVLGPEESDTLLAVVPAQGNRRVRSGLQWQSSDTMVVQVGPTGVVTARAPGEASVIAAGFGQERKVPVLVHRIPQSIVVTPGPGAGDIKLPLRATQKLTATAEAADSTPIPEARFQWSVGDTSIVAFDVTRTTLVGKALGTTTVTARLRGFEPVVWTVDVIPGTLGLEHALLGLRMGERRTLRASLVDDSSRVIAPATGLTWSADPGDVVQVSGEGVLDGLVPGRATVTAAAPWGQKATAQVIVTGDLFVSSNRGGRFGIYQLRASVTDAFYPVLTDVGANVQAVLSPDRTRVAFSSDRNGSFDLFVMDADGRNTRRLTTDGGTEGEPVWTPDGSRIVFTSNQPGAGSQLRSIMPDGKDPRLLTNSPGGNLSPDLSPDGSTIAFVSAREGNQDIYLMDIAGGAARRVTKTGARESSPRFLPSGELLYVLERGRGSRIMRLAPGGTPAMVLETDRPIASLDVSRDGERIAYVTGRLADVQKGKAEFRLYLHPLSPGATPTQIPLRPGEQVVSPAF